MSKNISKEVFYRLPSGAMVHPSRLIIRDGTVMWKHALTNNHGNVAVPLEAAHEAHIVKTASRLEELNIWVSQNLEIWNCFYPTVWLDPSIPEYSQGIQVKFSHFTIPAAEVYETLAPNILQHETLTLTDNSLIFRRC